MLSKEIDRRFTYSKPYAERAVLHEQVTERTRNLAHWLNDVLPEGREKSLAITHLEDVRMRANQAIATQVDLGIDAMQSRVEPWPS
jgi:hypothetical protein